MSGAGIRPQPPIAARDVPASSRWCQRLLVLLWLQAGDFEIWRRDPEGYVVVLASACGDL
ncbi:MAG: hypothetical protein ACHQ8D_02195 [Candidatus Rokuibacteriota bacterium]